MQTEKLPTNTSQTPQAPQEGAACSETPAAAKHGAPRWLKLGLAISLGLNGLLVVWLLLGALRATGVALPAAAADDAPNPKYTQQDIGRSRSVTAGMTMASVKEVLGDPAVKEIAAGREEWHYCRTGKTVDEYVAITFSDQNVSDLQYYTVHALDLLSHYAEHSARSQIPVGGDCRLTVRWGTYSQRTPNASSWSKKAEVPAVAAKR